MSIRYLAAVVLLATMVLSGCGDDEEPVGNAMGNADESTDTDEDSTDEDDDGDLRDADELLQEGERQGALEAEIDEPTELGDLTVSVSDIALESAEGSPGTDDRAILSVQLRAENHGDAQLEGVEVAVVCADGTDGGWYVDSTFDMYEPLPPDTFREGVLKLGVPNGCEDPVVRVEPYAAIVYDDDEPLAAVWAIPDGVLP